MIHCDTLPRQFQCDLRSGAGYCNPLSHNPETGATFGPIVNYGTCSSEGVVPIGRVVHRPNTQKVYTDAVRALVWVNTAGLENIAAEEKQDRLRWVFSFCFYRPVSDST